MAQPPSSTPATDYLQKLNHRDEDIKAWLGASDYLRSQYMEHLYSCQQALNDPQGAGKLGAPSPMRVSEFLAAHKLNSQVAPWDTAFNEYCASKAGEDGSLESWLEKNQG